MKMPKMPKLPKVPQAPKLAKPYKPAPAPKPAAPVSTGSYTVNPHRNAPTGQMDKKGGGR